MLDGEFLTIGQMCESFGVTPRTLRFYESRGLLAPRRQGQHRHYGRREYVRLTLILCGRRFGFTLEQMRGLLEMYRSGGDNTAQTVATLAIARERLAELRAQQAQLTDIIAGLAARISAADAMLGQTAAPLPHAISGQPDKDDP